jgi:hypothetical protein
MKMIARMTIWLYDDGSTGLHTHVPEQAGKVDPEDILVKGMGVLFNERQALKNCPIHNKGKRQHA